MSNSIHHSCKQMRRRLVTRSKFNVLTKERHSEQTEWETAECGSPLFGNVEQTTGYCRSCASGWTHPNNYPVSIHSPYRSA